MARTATPAELAATIDPLAQQLAGRARRVLEQHGPIAGPHHAYGLLAEELAEFFDETRKKREDRSPRALKNEALDIATIALRYAAQLDHEMAAEVGCAGCAKVERHPGEGYVCAFHGGKP